MGTRDGGHADEKYRTSPSITSRVPFGPFVFARLWSKCLNALQLSRLSTVKDGRAGAEAMRLLFRHGFHSENGPIKYEMRST